MKYKIFTKTDKKLNDISKTIKIVVLVLFISLSSYAQDPQLFENDWYLQKVVINDQDIFPPNLENEPETGQIYFIKADGIVTITYCASKIPTIDYDLDLNFFNLQNDPTTVLGVCIHPENILFAIDYFSVFYTQQQISISPFSYSFSSENDITTLTVINADGNKAIYGNELLSNQNFDDLSFTFYPNPVKEILYIKKQKLVKVKNIRVYDISGKLIVEEKGDVKQLDISILKSGLFFIKIETDQAVITKKIIKL